MKTTNNNSPKYFKKIENICDRYENADKMCEIIEELRDEANDYVCDCIESGDYILSYNTDRNAKIFVVYPEAYIEQKVIAGFWSNMPGIFGRRFIYLIKGSDSIGFCDFIADYIAANLAQLQETKRRHITDDCGLAEDGKDIAIKYCRNNYDYIAEVMKEYLIIESEAKTKAPGNFSDFELYIKSDENARNILRALWG